MHVRKDIARRRGGTKGGRQEWSQIAGDGKGSPGGVNRDETYERRIMTLPTTSMQPTGGTGEAAANGNGGTAVPVGALHQVWKSETASIRSSSSLKGRSVTYGHLREAADRAGSTGGFHATTGHSYGMASSAISSMSGNCLSTVSRQSSGTRPGSPHLRLSTAGAEQSARPRAMLRVANLVGDLAGVDDVAGAEEVPLVRMPRSYHKHNEFFTRRSRTAMDMTRDASQPVQHSNTHQHQNSHANVTPQAMESGAGSASFVSSMASMTMTSSLQPQLGSQQTMPGASCLQTFEKILPPLTSLNSATHGIRINLTENELARLGMDARQVERIHRLVGLYTTGLHNLVAELGGASPRLAARAWASAVKEVEELIGQSLESPLRDLAEQAEHAHNSNDTALKIARARAEHQRHEMLKFAATEARDALRTSQRQSREVMESLESERRAVLDKEARYLEEVSKRKLAEEEISDLVALPMQLSSFAKRIHHLNKDKERLETRAAAAEGKLAKSAREMKTMTRDLRVHQKKLRAREDEIKVAEKNLHEMQQQVSTMRRENQHVLKEMCSKQDEMNANLESQQHLEEKLRDMEEENLNYEMRLARSSKEISRLTEMSGRVDALESRLESSEEAVQQRDATIARLEGEVVAFREEKRAYESRLADMGDERASLQRQLSGTAKELRELMQKSAIERVRLEELEVQIKTAEEDIEMRYRDTEIALRREVERSQSDVTELILSQAVAQAAQATAERRSAMYISSISAQQDAAALAVRKQEQETRKMEDQRKRDTESINILRREVNSLKENLQTSGERWQRTRQQLHEDLSNLNVDLSSATQANAEASVTIRSLQSKVNELEKDKGKLERELSQKASALGNIELSVAARFENLETKADHERALRKEAEDSLSLVMRELKMALSSQNANGRAAQNMDTTTREQHRAMAIRSTSTSTSTSTEPLVVPAIASGGVSGDLRAVTPEETAATLSAIRRRDEKMSNAAALDFEDDDGFLGDSSDKRRLEEVQASATLMKREEDDAREEEQEAARELEEATKTNEVAQTEKEAIERHASTLRHEEEITESKRKVATLEFRIASLQESLELAQAAQLHITVQESGVSASISAIETEESMNTRVPELESHSQSSSTPSVDSHPSVPTRVENLIDVGASDVRELRAEIKTLQDQLISSRSEHDQLVKEVSSASDKSGSTKNGNDDKEAGAASLKIALNANVAPGHEKLTSPTATADGAEQQTEPLVDPSEIVSVDPKSVRLGGGAACADDKQDLRERWAKEALQENSSPAPLDPVVPPAARTDVSTPKASAVMECDEDMDSPDSSLDSAQDSPVRSTDAPVATSSSSVEQQGMEGIAAAWADPGGVAGGVSCETRSDASGADTQPSAQPVASEGVHDDSVEVGNAAVARIEEPGLNADDPAQESAVSPILEAADPADELLSGRQDGRHGDQKVGWPGTTSTRTRSDSPDSIGDSDAAEIASGDTLGELAPDARAKATPLLRPGTVAATVRRVVATSTVTDTHANASGATQGDRSPDGSHQPKATGSSLVAAATEPSLETERPQERVGDREESPAESVTRVSYDCQETEAARPGAGEVVASDAGIVVRMGAHEGRAEEQELLARIEAMRDAMLSMQSCRHRIVRLQQYLAATGDGEDESDATALAAEDMEEFREYELREGSGWKLRRMDSLLCEHGCAARVFLSLRIDVHHKWVCVRQTPLLKALANAKSGGDDALALSAVEQCMAEFSLVDADGVGACSELVKHCTDTLRDHGERVMSSIDAFGSLSDASEFRVAIRSLLVDVDFQDAISTLHKSVVASHSCMLEEQYWTFALARASSTSSSPAHPMASGPSAQLALSVARDAYAAARVFRSDCARHYAGRLDALECGTELASVADGLERVERERLSRDVEYACLVLDDLAAISGSESTLATLIESLAADRMRGELLCVLSCKTRTLVELISRPTADSAPTSPPKDAGASAEESLLRESKVQLSREIEDLQAELVVSFQEMGEQLLTALQGGVGQLRRAEEKLVDVMLASENASDIEFHIARYVKMATARRKTVASLVYVIECYAREAEGMASQLAEALHLESLGSNRQYNDMILVSGVRKAVEGVTEAAMSAASDLIRAIDEAVRAHDDTVGRWSQQVKAEHPELMTQELRDIFSACTLESADALTQKIVRELFPETVNGEGDEEHAPTSWRRCLSYPGMVVMAHAKAQLCSAEDACNVLQHLVRTGRSEVQRVAKVLSKLFSGTFKQEMEDRLKEVEENTIEWSMWLQAYYSSTGVLRKHLADMKGAVLHQVNKIRTDGPGIEGEQTEDTPLPPLHYFRAQGALPEAEAESANMRSQLLCVQSRALVLKCDLRSVERNLLRIGKMVNARTSIEVEKILKDKRMQLESLSEQLSSAQQRHEQQETALQEAVQRAKEAEATLKEQQFAVLGIRTPQTPSAAGANAAHVFEECAPPKMESVDNVPLCSDDLPADKENKHGVGESSGGASAPEGTGDPEQQQQQHEEQQQQPYAKISVLDVGETQCYDAKRPDGNPSDAKEGAAEDGSRHSQGGLVRITDDSGAPLDGGHFEASVEEIDNLFASLQDSAITLDPFDHNRDEDIGVVGGNASLQATSNVQQEYDQRVLEECAIQSGCLFAHKAYCDDGGTFLVHLPRHAGKWSVRPSETNALSVLSIGGLQSDFPGMVIPPVPYAKRRQKSAVDAMHKYTFRASSRLSRRRNKTIDDEMTQWLDTHTFRRERLIQALIDLNMSCRLPHDNDKKRLMLPMHIAELVQKYIVRRRKLHQDYKNNMRKGSDAGRGAFNSIQLDTYHHNLLNTL